MKINHAKLYQIFVNYWEDFRYSSN